MVSSQDIFAEGTGVAPEAPEGPEPQPDILLPRPVPSPQPPGNDEKRTYEQYYRRFWQTKVWDVDLSGTPAVGTRIVNTSSKLSGFPARSLIIDNVSGYVFWLYIDGNRIIIPSGVVNCVRPLPESINDVLLYVKTTGTSDACVLTFTEEPIPPNPGTPATPAGTAASVTIAGPLGQAAMAASVPVVVASDQSAIATTATVAHARTGSQANLWNAATTGTGGNSTIFDMLSGNALSVFGHVSAATTISLQFSADNANYYTVNSVVLGAASDFGFTDTMVGARYMRLQSSNSVTATATAQVAA